jgi:iron complex transport system ATP-binding protein
MLSIDKACCGYGHKVILSEISLGVEKGEVLCLLGPNGVGKTTLFKAVLGLIKLMGGEIRIKGKSVSEISPRQKARLMGYVPQVHDPPFPYRALEVVLLGRTAYIGAFSSPGREDERIAMEAMSSIGISHLREKIYTELSGGERQLVLIARALTQRADVLVMDEPTSNLDFGNQIRVLKEINNLASQGHCVIMTSHFPNHAFLCSTKVALIKNNRNIQIGRCNEVITEENLKDTYGIDVKIAEVIDAEGRPIRACIPMMAN